MTSRPAAVLALVFVGGAAGTGMRHAVDLGFEHIGVSALLALLVINSAGSTGLGWLVSVVDDGSVWRSFVGVGFLGSFTTFSAYTVSVVDRLDHGLPGVAVCFAFGSILLGWAGATVGRRIGGRR